MTPKFERWPLATTFAAAALLTGFLITARAEDTNFTRFTPDRFAIGFWVDPPAEQQTDARFAEIAEANFTFVIGNFGATTPDTVQKLLRLCEKHGLKAVVSMAGLPPEKLPESPACWGYHLVDEPGAGAFPSLRPTVDAIRKARPGRLTYINLFPDYASPEALGTSNYTEHVARFIAEVRPDVLSMDHYPIFLPEADGRDGYCRNLDVFREQSLKAGIPFWNFFNTMPYGPHSDPTEAQLRWQIYASVAYGAKGVMYFCYWTPAGGEFPKGGAIIRRDGTRTRHYDEAKRLNAALKKLGPTLMQLTSTAVHRIKSKDNPTTALRNSPLKSLTSGEYLVGDFVHKDGRRAVLIQNYHITYAEWPTVEFSTPSNEVVEVSPVTGKETPAYDESPDMPGLQISLDAGEGRLFLVPAGK